jgi:hypothetical protein
MEKFRFNTTLNFRNKKESEKYWDNLLMDNPARYRNEYHNFLDEKVEIYYSFSKAYNSLFLVLFLIALISSPSSSTSSIFIFAAATLCKIVSFVFAQKYLNFSLKVFITKQINTLEFVEKLRELVIEHKK